jgi:hypothetical protein
MSFSEAASELQDSDIAKRRLATSQELHSSKPGRIIENQVFVRIISMWPFLLIPKTPAGHALPEAAAGQQTYSFNRKGQPKRQHLGESVPDLGPCRLSIGPRDRPSKGWEGLGPPGARVLPRCPRRVGIAARRPRKPPRGSRAPSQQKDQKNEENVRTTEIWPQRVWARPRRRH